MVWFALSGVRRRWSRLREPERFKEFLEKDRAFARELLEAIAWRHPQVVQGLGRVEHDELP